MTPEHLQVLQRLCREYRINFGGEIIPEKWPEGHRIAFETVKKLGTKTFAEYMQDVTKHDTPGASDERPWKKELVNLVDKLVTSAARCSQRNESSWRMACEPLIFGRLSAEVVCQKCKKRLWRSEIEARRIEFEAAEAEASRAESTRAGEVEFSATETEVRRERSAAAEALRARQNARTPCHCRREDRESDQFEATGLNRIFGHREDDPVHHERELSEKLGRNTDGSRSQHNKTQSPDAVYGLRLTRNIENLLHDAPNTGMLEDVGAKPQHVHQLLDPSPFERPLRQTGDSLLFPFLILEAKSGTASDDWHSIQMQTALPIRAFLEAQDSLRRATKSRSKWTSGPLVWFFANRGEDWRLSAAFMNDSPNNSHITGTRDYRIVDLWRGSILTHNGALQLLLLVDYVFDWARDIYREDIIRELRVLASQENDRATINPTDTDIYSTRNVEASEHIGLADAREEFEVFHTSQGNFMALDSGKGVVRHSDLVESRYCCVYLTRDNIRTFAHSIRQSNLRKLCSLILEHMASSHLIDEKTLDTIGEQWAGSRWYSSAPRRPNMQFYAALSSTTYLSGNWHIIRELYVIAIAINAWEELLDVSKFKRGRGKAVERPLAYDLGPLDSATLLKLIKQLKAGSPRYVLLAAIKRRAIVLKRTQRATVWLPENGIFRDTVHFLYRDFKKGTLEPSEPFLRFSKRHECQHTLQIDEEPLRLVEELQVSDEDCVLISSNCHHQDPEKSNSTVCAYLVDENSTSTLDRSVLARKIGRTYEEHDVYHTTQDNGKSNIMTIPVKKKLRSDRAVPWNLEETYGIYVYGFEFLVFILELGGHLPSTQGTPRLYVDSGSYLHEKQTMPWSDRRMFANSDILQRRTFIIYKLLTREILYWRMIASERRELGLSCCSSCAKLGDDDRCTDCWRALRSHEKPQWYKNAVQNGSLIQYSASKDNKLTPDWWQPDGPKEHTDECRFLEPYPHLNRRFMNIGDLSSQLRAFEKWRKAKDEEWELPSRGKRKREANEGSESLRSNGQTDDVGQQSKQKIKAEF